MNNNHSRMSCVIRYYSYYSYYYYYYYYYYYEWYGHHATHLFAVKRLPVRSFAFPFPLLSRPSLSFLTSDVRLPLLSRPVVVVVVHPGPPTPRQP